jgi:hypothetical protein
MSTVFPDVEVPVELLDEELLEQPAAARATAATAASAGASFLAFKSVSSRFLDFPACQAAPACMSKHARPRAGAG